MATFYFPRDDEAVHVVPGDELVLQHDTGVPLTLRMSLRMFVLEAFFATAVYTLDAEDTRLQFCSP